MRLAIPLCILLIVLVPGTVLAQPTNITGLWIPEQVLGLNENGPALNLTSTYGIFSVDTLSEAGFTGTRTINKDGSSVLVLCNGTFLPDKTGFILLDTDGGTQFARIDDPETITLYILSPFPETPETTAGVDVIVLTLKKELPERGFNVLVGAMGSAYAEDQQDLTEAEMAGKENHELYAGATVTTECDESGCYCDGEGCQCSGSECYCEGDNCVQDESGYSCSGWDCWLTCNTGEDCSMET